MPRFYCPIPLTEGATADLPPGAARHVQVLRLQPGDALTLFNGHGGAFSATVQRMGRSNVQVGIGAHDPSECEAATPVHLAVGMPANDRMDWLVEKATELGVASIQPLMTAHSVLRLKGERADKKQAHWHSVAVAACEQCGRNRLPTVHPVAELADWLTRPPAPGTARAVLSLAHGQQALPTWLAGLGTQATGERQQAPVFLSGPEGGLSAAEDELARSLGWQPVGLGQRVLRAETAALAALVLATQTRL